VSLASQVLNSIFTWSSLISY